MVLGPFWVKSEIQHRHNTLKLGALYLCQRGYLAQAFDTSPWHVWPCAKHALPSKRAVNAAAVAFWSLHSSTLGWQDLRLRSIVRARVLFQSVCGRCMPEMM